jgi:hypothetical protein
MKIPIPKFYDRVMDVIAIVLFPSQKYVYATLAGYTMLLAGGLAWYFDSWLWVPAVGLSMIMAWLMLEML